MPSFLRAVADRFERKDTQSVNRYECFQSNGAVVLRDRRGTAKAEIPDVSTKSETLGDDPLAIYKPTGAKSVDAAKAMGSFTGWSYAAVNAISRELSNIEWRLYQITVGVIASCLLRTFNPSPYGHASSGDVAASR